MVHFSYMKSVLTKYTDYPNISYGKKMQHLTRKGDEIYTEEKDDVLLKLLKRRSLKLQPATFRDASTGAFAVKPVEALQQVGFISA